MNASERERLALLIESLRGRAKHPVLTTVELITGLEELSLPSFVVDRVKEQAESWSDKQINFCRKWARKEWLLWYYMEW